MASSKVYYKQPFRSLNATSTALLLEKFTYSTPILICKIVFGNICISTELVFESGRKIRIRVECYSYVRHI